MSDPIPGGTHFDFKSQFVPPSDPWAFDAAQVEALLARHRDEDPDATPDHLFDAARSIRTVADLMEFAGALAIQLPCAFLIAAALVEADIPGFVNGYVHSPSSTYVTASLDPEGTYTFGVDPVSARPVDLVESRDVPVLQGALDRVVAAVAGGLRALARRKEGEARDLRDSAARSELTPLMTLAGPGSAP